MTKTKALEPVAAVMNGAVYGYRPAQSTRHVIADPALYDRPNALFAEALNHLLPDTAACFEADISDSLTIAQQRRMTLQVPWSDVYQQIAPHVLGWNAHAQNEETGEWEPLPPPAEAGPDVFESLPMKRTNTGWTHPVAMFLWLCIAANHGGDVPKERSAIADMVDGEDAVN